MSVSHETMKIATGAQLVPRAAQTNAPSNSSSSATTLLSTLIPALAVAILYFAVFVVLRLKIPRVYMPRTFLGSLRKEKRTPSLPNGRFNWFKKFFALPDTYVLNHHTLDGYLFLRFLKMAVVTCLVGMVITWPILFPVNATGGGDAKQLDVLNMSNISGNYYRYFAHVVCAYIFYGFVLFMITRESIFYINLRQAYLLSPLYASRLSSRTVLFTSVPDDYLDETVLRRTLGNAVKRIWIATDTQDLDDLVDQRDTAANKLEIAETKLIRTANGKRLKAEKKENKNGSGKNNSDATAVESGNVAGRWITEKDRPTHRLKPLIGKKVNTIDWARAELEKLIPQVEEEQAKHRNHKAKKVGSVFVEFTTVPEAQNAYQSLTHHQVLHMAPRYTGMTPGEIIWSNLRINWWERIIRKIVVISIVTVLVIFWSVPVAFIGAISNVNALAHSYSWLSWLLNMPPVIFGVISGLLPSILLAALMALLPIFLRLMGRVAGNPTLSAVELSCQNYYFAFQVVDVFLITTLGSSAASAVGTIARNPVGITNLLATSLPNASDFYLSYFCLQGLGVVSGILLNTVPLILFLLTSKIANTPRKLYNSWTNLSGMFWGTLFPVYTTLFVIALCYAIIAPLVLLFATIGLYFFYIAFKYNLLFTQNANIDTKGKCYPKALQHTFVGLYIAEVCIIGLFAIGTGSGNGAIGPLILMIIFLVFTVLYHISLNSALGPLIDSLPKSLEAEESRLLEEERLNDDKVHDDINGDTNGDVNGRASKLGPPPHQKPNFLTKFLKPHIYNDYQTMRRLVPGNIEIRYEPEDEELAYYAPSIMNPVQLIWIPRDPMGLSQEEIRATPKILTITDEDASLDDKNKIVWDAEGGRPPIYQPEIYY
ncbi:hypothetical protein MBLNU457_5576t1 [Dothideomycetes sp. NU457]